MTRSSNIKALGGALLALLGGAIWLWLHEQPTSLRPAPSASTQPESQRIPIKSVVMNRRDANFWPQQPHPIAMRYRTLNPSQDFPKDSGLKPEQRLVWLVQFGGPVTPTERDALEQKGITLLMPTVANAFHARASHLALKSAAAEFVPRILGWCRLSPDEKLMPSVRSDRVPAYAFASGGQIKRRLELYPIADLSTLCNEIAAIGGQVSRMDLPHAAQVPGVTRSIEVSGPPGAEFSAKLATLEGVYAVDYPRPLKSVCNEQAAAASNITPLLSAPENLTGVGITVLVRDQAAIFNHPDYASRLTLGPDAAVETPVQHSTHVAGTIGGDGLVNPSALAKGMAQSATIISFDLAGDDVNEPLDAKNSFGALLSNHSYGFITGWDSGIFTNNQDTFGQYSTFARNWDALARSNGLIMIKAAGNDRNDSGPGQPHDGTQAADGEFYDCTDSSSTGKNILVVGATQDGIIAGSTISATSVLPGSSSGPTDDGRLRPEICANGDNVNSCNNSTTPGNEYVQLSGTSMASAVVCGATALFLERYQRRFGSGAFPPPDYIRALYAQTATDLGRTGPDYLHGYGLLDLSAAIALFEADVPSGKRIINGTLDATTGERFYILDSDGVTPIRATLCWTDDPGDILASKSIINDLDLRLIRVADQSETLPWVLDQLAPEKPATNGVNRVDTIEQVVLGNPQSGKYILSVRGATLATSTNFTLVSSHDLTETPAPIAKIVSSSLTGPSPFPVNFDASTSTAPGGSIVQYLWDFGDATTGSGVSIQHTYADGSFKTVLKVIDDKGASNTATVIVAVNNIPPIANLSASPNSGAAPLTTLISSFGSIDPDGALTALDWDFGDGSTAKDVSQLSHTFVAPGLYYVTLAVTDTGNARASRTITVLAGTTLQPSASRLNLNFQKLLLDRFTLTSKTLAIDPGLIPGGLMGTVTLGSSQFEFTLDSKGKFKSPQLSVRLDPAKKFVSITLNHVNLVQGLTKTGATNRDISNVLVTLPFAFSLSNDLVLGSPGLPYVYNAKKGKTGSGKLFIPK